MKEIRIGFLFPAAGHWLQAAKNAGLNPLWVYEEGKHEANTCRINFPFIPIICSFLEERSLSPVDIIVGSPPCKGFSLARSRKCDINETCNQIPIRFWKTVTRLKPLMAIMENVPPITSRGKPILDQCHELIRGDYISEERFLRASDYGSCQDRNRFFLVAGRKSWIDQEKLKKIFPTQDKKKVFLKDVIKNLEDIPLGSRINHISKVVDFNKVYAGIKYGHLTPDRKPKLKDRGYNDLSRVIHRQACLFPHPTLNRRLSLLEAIKIMGLPENWKFQTNSLDLKFLMVAEGVDVTLTTKLLRKAKIFLLKYRKEKEN